MGSAVPKEEMIAWGEYGLMHRSRQHTHNHHRTPAARRVSYESRGAQGYRSRGLNVSHAHTLPRLNTLLTIGNLVK